MYIIIIIIILKCDILTLKEYSMQIRKRISYFFYLSNGILKILYYIIIYDNFHIHI